MKSDTVYGIFCVATDAAAVAKLHDVRERDAAQGFIVLADSVGAVAEIVELKPEIRARLKQIWSGRNPATSVILSAKNSRFSWLADARAEFRDTICLRVPNDETLRKLLKQTGPLCAPSANLPDQPPARNIAEARNYFGENVKLYVDGGECDGGVASRIVKFVAGGVETVRADNLPHPEDFVISRRRKQFRFAKFAEFASCFQLAEWLKVRDDLLEGDNDLVVEIAAGSALFSVELARRRLKTIFVAVDIKSDRLYRGARRAAELGLENIYFVRSDIAKIAEIIPPRRACEIWLTFPDPQPPARDAKHRLTAPRFLALYQQILRADGVLNFKTDSAPLFDWSLEQLALAGWQTKFITRNLHTAAAPDEAKIMTSYEARFVDAGLKISYIQAVKN